ncbi:hypothetical protein GCM10027051_27030 [Niabella terrae]
MNTRFLYCLIIIALCIVAATGCERVIEVNIEHAQKRVVIEGMLTDDSICRVRISTTSNFEDTVDLEGIRRARVTLSQTNGQLIELAETEDAGVYRARFSGRSGQTYTLRVDLTGAANLDPGIAKVYTASSTMPAKVEIDSLYVTKRTFLGSQKMVATVQFTDPKATGNAYRFIQYVDGRKETNLFLLNDLLLNGRTVVNELLIFDEEYTLHKCDQLRVVMQCIDEPNYLFWYSLNQSSLGTSQTAAPANPASNFTGGALGYFSAHTVSEKNIAVFPDSTCSIAAGYGR